MGKVAVVYSYGTGNPTEAVICTNGAELTTEPTDATTYYSISGQTNNESHVFVVQSAKGDTWQKAIQCDRTTAGLPSHLNPPYTVNGVEL